MFEDAFILKLTPLAFVLKRKYIVVTSFLVLHQLAWLPKLNFKLQIVMQL